MNANNESQQSETTEKKKADISMKYLIIFIISSLLAISVLFILAINNNEKSLTDTQTEKPDSIAVNDVQDNEIDIKQTRVLSGTIINIDPDGEYIRIAIPDDGVYSVGISDSTSTENVFSNLENMSTISIEVYPQDSTDIYDFIVDEKVIMQHIENNIDEEMSIDERVERLRLLTPDAL